MVATAASEWPQLQYAHHAVDDAVPMGSIQNQTSTFRTGVIEGRLSHDFSLQ
jgi:hypothetical protein